jgi:hypothetical protein
MPFRVQKYLQILSCIPNYPRCEVSNIAAQSPPGLASSLTFTPEGVGVIAIQALQA